MMNRDRVLSWPQTGYYASALLIGVSTLLFWLAVLEWHPLRWSRPALGLLGLALLLALLLLRWHPPRRLFVYPILLVCVIYLWDTTLPPPNLPEGSIRQFIPHAVLAGLLVDLGLALWPTRQPRQPRTRVQGGYLTVEGAALLLRITPKDLHARLERAGRFAVVVADGHEYISLDDLLVMLEQWNHMDAR